MYVPGMVFCPLSCHLNFKNPQGGDTELVEEGHYAGCSIVIWLIHL